MNDYLSMTVLFCKKMAGVLHVYGEIRNYECCCSKENG